MYTREASALDLFTDSVRLMGDATLCAVMEFDGQLDPRALEAAAQACLEAHPVLHSRLVRGNGPARWELVEPARVSPVQPEACAAGYHPRVIGPVDPHGPLQFRVRLLRRPAGDVVVVNLAHAAADASGLHALASELLREYGAPGSIHPAQGGIPERDTLWTRELAPEPPAYPGMPVINPLWPDLFGTSQAPSSYHRDRVSPAALEAVRARARALGGNLNDAVMASYFLAMSDLTSHRGPVDVYFPVDLRRHLDNGSRVMSNQATNVCFTLERGPGEGMEEVLFRVVGATTALKAGGRIGLAEQAGMDALSDPGGRRVHEMAERMAALQGEGLADIFVSNPGRITLPDVDGLSDAYVCYPGGLMPATCFVTSTFRGQMTVTMGYQDSDRARTGTRRVMDLFRHHLLSLAGGG